MSATTTDQPDGRPVPNIDGGYDQPPDELAAARHGNQPRAKTTRQVLPHDLDVEQYLLGAALLDPAAAEHLAAIPTNAFYKPAHGHIAHAIRTLHTTGAHLDTATVADQLRRDGLLDHAGGTPYLAGLMVGTPSTKGAPTYAQIIRDHHRSRQLITAAHELDQAVRTHGPEAAHNILRALTEVTDAELANIEALESWQPIELDLILAGDHEQPTPTLLRTRDDRQAFLYPGKVNGFHGDSGIGKSWMAYKAVAQEITAGHRAIILDYEATAPEVVDRLLKIGASAQQITDHLVYIQPNDTTSDLAIRAVLEQITPTTTIIVIDSLGEAFGVDGIDENSDAEVGPWLRRVARPLADAGPAVVLIDHGTKAADNPLHPSGSKRKRAAITGASYLVTAKTTPTRESPGTLSLTCAKDRHGTYARGKTIASVDITPYPDGGVSINIHQHADTAERPDAILESIARAFIRTAKTHGRALSRNELLALTDTKARTETKRAAIDYAVGRGALSVETGPRNALLHRYLADLPEPEEDDR